MGNRTIAVYSKPQDGDEIGPTRPADSADKVTDGNGCVIDCRYAEIHSSDSTSSQAIANGASYTKLIPFDDNGMSQRATPDAANDKIIFTIAGKYKVDCTMSFLCGTNNTVWRIAAFVDGVEKHQCHFMRKIGTATDAGSAAFSGFVNVTASNLDLDVRARHNKAGSVDIEITYVNLNITYLGDS